MFNIVIFEYKSSFFYNPLFNNLNENYQIKIFNDEHEFINVLNKNIIDLLILDMNDKQYFKSKIFDLEAIKHTHILLIIDQIDFHILKMCYQYNIYKIIKSIEYSLSEINKITFKIGREIIVLNFIDILAIYSEGHYLNIVTNQSIYRSRRSFKDINKCLTMNGFIKINSNTYINMNYIKQITHNGIFLNNKTHYPISKKAYKNILKKFIDFTNNSINFLPKKDK